MTSAESQIRLTCACFLLAVALLPRTADAWATASPVAQDRNEEVYYCRSASSDDHAHYYTNVVYSAGTHREINVGWVHYMAKKYGDVSGAMCSWGDRAGLEKLLASDIRDDNRFKRRVVQTGWKYAGDGSAPSAQLAPTVAPVALLGSQNPNDSNIRYVTKFVSCSTEGGPDPIYFSGIFEMTLKGRPKARGVSYNSDVFDPAKDAFVKYLKQKYSYGKAARYLTCDMSATEPKAQEAKQYRESGMKGPREGKIVETGWKYVAARN